MKTIEKQLTENVIASQFVRQMFLRSFCVPNYTPNCWWECDVFVVTQAGYFHEYEIKLTYSDFKADAKKGAGVWNGGRVWNDQTQQWVQQEPEAKKTKHDFLRARSKLGPSQFCYIVPFELALKVESEVPEFAGLVAARFDTVSGYVVFETIKKSPRLHNEKLRDAIKNHAKNVCYYRMHNYYRTIADHKLGQLSEVKNEND